MCDPLVLRPPGEVERRPLLGGDRLVEGAFHADERPVARQRLAGQGAHHRRYLTAHVLRVATRARDRAVLRRDLHEIPRVATTLIAAIRSLMEKARRAPSAVLLPP